MQEGEPSYKLYAEEKQSLLDSLKRRAIKLHKTLSSLQGVTCTEPEGALYAMPQIRLPKAAIEVGACACTLRAARSPVVSELCMQCAIPGLDASCKMRLLPLLGSASTPAFGEYHYS